MPTYTGFKSDDDVTDPRAPEFALNRNAEPGLGGMGVAKRDAQESYGPRSQTAQDYYQQAYQRGGGDPEDVMRDLTGQRNWGKQELNPELQKAEHQAVGNFLMRDMGPIGPLVAPPVYNAGKLAVQSLPEDSAIRQSKVGQFFGSPTTTPPSWGSVGAGMHALVDPHAWAQFLQQFNRRPLK